MTISPETLFEWATDAYRGEDVCLDGATLDELGAQLSARGWPAGLDGSSHRPDTGDVTLHFASPEAARVFTDLLWSMAPGVDV